MEVMIPEIPPKYNFSDIDALAGEMEENQYGSYPKKLAIFLRDEIRKLRQSFVPRDPSHPNRDEYEQVFDSSLDLIKNFLEEIWCTPQFDCSNFKAKFFKMEEMKRTTEPWLEDLKNQIDNLSGWKITPPQCNRPVLEKLVDLRNRLGTMESEMEELTTMYVDLKDKYQRTSCMYLSKLTSLTIWHATHDGDATIVGRLKTLLLQRQSVVIQSDIVELRVLVAMMENIVVIRRDFIREWDKWLCEQIFWKRMNTFGMNNGVRGTR